MTPSTRDLSRPSSGRRPRTVEVMALVFTELPEATPLRERLGNQEAWNLIEQHHTEVRALLKNFPDGIEVGTRDDALHFAFARPSDAVQFALQMQARLRRWNRFRAYPLADRIAIHAGEVMVERDPGSDRIQSIHGLETDKCARISALAGANHILITRFAYENARSMLKNQRIPGVGEVVWATHGYYEFFGVSEPVEICEVADARSTPLEAPRDTDHARRCPDQTAIEIAAADSGAGDTWFTRISTRQRVSRRRRYLAAAATALLGAMTLVFPFMDAFTRASYDFAYLFRRIEPPGEAVIVRMDRRSHDELGQPWLQPWDRRIHARLVEKMQEFGARAVVFDVLFDQPAADPGEDAALITAAKKFGKVVVAGIETMDLRSGVMVGRRIEGPFLGLRDVVRWGVVNRADEDLFIRQPAPGSGLKSSLSEEGAKVFAAEGLKLPATTPWMNYYGPPGTIKSFAFSQVLTNQVLGRNFEDKIVFVGAVYDLGYTGGRGTDDFRTPYSRLTGLRTPGVEVSATSCLNLIRGDWLRRLSPWTELGLVLALGAVAGWGFTLLRPGFAGIIAVLGALLVAAAGMILVWRTDIWFPWLIPATLQIPAAFVISLFVKPQQPVAGQTEFRLRQTDLLARRDGVTPRGSKALPPARPPNNPEAQVTVRDNPSPLPANGPSPPKETERNSMALTAIDEKPSIPHYSLIRPIGRGGYGEVWLASDAVGVYRAIKFVYRNSFSEAAPYEREFEGIRCFSPVALRHPGMIHLLHVGRNNALGYFYYVMETADDHLRGPEIDPHTYVPRTLQTDLERLGYLEAKEAVVLGLELSDGLEFLHRQHLIHRDIKPANILFSHGRPKLGDIGLVTSVQDTTEAISFVGTRGYLPPEGPGAVTADIYSLGKLLYVAVTGQSVSQFPELPPSFDQRSDRDELVALNSILLKACDPNPAERHQTAQALLEALLKMRGPTKPAFNLEGQKLDAPA